MPKIIIQILFPVISLITLVAVRFIPKKGKWRRFWIVCCIINLFIASYSSYKNFHNDRKIEHLEYSKISEYNIFGNISGKFNGIPFKRSPIQDWSRNYVKEMQDNVYDCRCDAKALEKYKEINRVIPNYPFTLYFIAKCYKENGNAEWLDFAKKANLILEKTTKIPGCHQQQKMILRKIKSMLNK